MRSSQVEVVACEMGRRTEVAADDRPVSAGSPHCDIEWTSGPARCACITQAHSSCVVRKTHSQYAAYDSLGPAMNRRRPLSPSVQRHRCHGFCVAGRRLYGASGLLVNWPYRCDDSLAVASPGVGDLRLLCLHAGRKGTGQTHPDLGRKRGQTRARAEGPAPQNAAMPGPVAILDLLVFQVVLEARKTLAGVTQRRRAATGRRGRAFSLLNLGLARLSARGCCLPDPSRVSPASPRTESESVCH